MTERQINVAGMPEFDALLDHIYEYGTASEGIIDRANAFARALLSRYAYAQGDMRSDIQNLEAARDGYRDDARALHAALVRMVAMYESEFDHEDTYLWRPDWLKSALARRNALDGNHDNQD